MHPGAWNAHRSSLKVLILLRCEAMGLDTPTDPPIQLEQRYRDGWVARQLKPIGGIQAGHTSPNDTHTLRLPTG
jgi:hypothetical protein